MSDCGVGHAHRVIGDLIDPGAVDVVVGGSATQIHGRNLFHLRQHVLRSAIGGASIGENRITAILGRGDRQVPVGTTGDDIAVIPGHLQYFGGGTRGRGIGIGA